MTDSSWIHIVQKYKITNSDIPPTFLCFGVIVVVHEITKYYYHTFLAVMTLR